MSFEGEARAFVSRWWRLERKIICVEVGLCGWLERQIFVRRYVFFLIIVFCYCGSNSKV